MPAVGAVALVGLVALGVAAGAVAAIAGFGIGSLLTPALALSIGAKAAVAVVAVPHAVATAVRLWSVRHAVRRRVLLTFGLASAAGGLVGALLHGMVTNPVLAVLLGALLVVSGLSELTAWRRRLELAPRWSILAGAASGLFGGLVGNQGGIRAAALLRLGLSGERLVATATATALMVDAARLPIYAVTSGAALVRHGDLIALITAGVVAGTLLGVPILRRLPETAFRRAIAVLLMLLGLGVIASEALSPAESSATSSALASRGFGAGMS